MVINYMPAPVNALDLIRSLIKKNITIKLTRSFRGVVLNQNVNIAGVNQDCASFKVIGKKIFSGLEEFVHLQSSLFPKAMVARIKSSDINKGTLTLSQFAYVATDWKERKQERVRPETPIYVDLHCNGKEMNACLADFSATGMGILAHKVLESGLDIRSGSAIKLDFQFPPDHAFTSMKGTIVYMHALNSSFVKLGILLFPNTVETLALERFITNRKLETMNELDQNFKELNNRHGVENTYF